MKFGYARVSKNEQSLDVQIQKLTQAGCDEIFKEKVSGAKDDRSQLNLLIGKLRKGDIVKCIELDGGYVIVKRKMSTSPYSVDLREKVIQFLAKGNSQKLASTIFNIHENTISRWNVRKTREGTIAPKARLGFKSKVDKQKLEDFVRSNPNVKLRDIGKEFGITGSQAGRILKKLGFSYKKKPLATWKQVQRNDLNI